MIDPDDDLLARLEALPRDDVDPATAERIRKKAQARFAERSRAGRAPASSAGSRWGRRIDLPLVAGAVIIYLVWAVQLLGTIRAADDFRVVEGGGDGLAFLSGKLLR
jgi:hypothetical protein